MTKLAVIGAGKMAEAIIQGILNKKVYTPQDIITTDISADRLQYMATTYGVRTSSNNLAALREAQTILLAVKPQTMHGVLAELWAVGNAQQIIISIAAGTTIATIDPDHTRKMQPGIYHQRRSYQGCKHERKRNDLPAQQAGAQAAHPGTVRWVTPQSLPNCRSRPSALSPARPRK